MSQNRLFETITQLNRSDFRQFDRFIRSPYFNRQEVLVRFWEYLSECFLHLKIVPDKPAVYRQLFGEQVYDDQKLRLLTSDLYQLLGDYLAFDAFQKEKTNFQYHRAKGFQERNLTEHFERTMQKCLQLNQKSGLTNDDFYRQNYQLKLELYHFQAKSDPGTDVYLQEITDQIDLSYLLSKLRQACLLLSHQAVYQGSFDLGLLPELLAYIHQRDLLKVPSIAVYYYCYHTLTSDQAEDFQQFKRLLIQHGTCFPHPELRELYLQAINYCIRQINEEHTHYFHEVIDLYKAGLNTESLLVGGLLSRFTYHNIVVAGLHTEAFNWVEDFIHTYRVNLDKRYRESSFSFNLARLAYGRKRYDEALPLLQKANYRDLLLNLAAKTLLLKIYYELDEQDLLQAHLDALRTFLRRKSVMGYHRENYQNLILFTRKLVSLNFYDKQAITRLKQEIQETDPLTEREWLLEQLNGR
ncbi:MAG: hypothetical protein DHS20C18_56050 [Saprospiraceae bacterium]|nr:MAG: hypothetical protein DHS20C18_56050 [Saprospiraceae bacterium]